MAFAVLISIIGGISNVVSRIINARLTDKIGIIGSTFFNYAVGLIFSSLLFASTKIILPIQASYSFAGIPIAAYLGGLVGIIVVGLSSYVSLKASAFYVSLFIFIGQLFTGILIDYINLGTVSSGKLFGGLLILAGLIINIQTDRAVDKQLA